MGVRLCGRILLCTGVYIYAQVHNDYEWVCNGLCMGVHLCGRVMTMCECIMSVCITFVLVIQASTVTL